MNDKINEWGSGGMKTRNNQNSKADKANILHLQPSS